MPRVMLLHGCSRSLLFRSLILKPQRRVDCRRLVHSCAAPSAVSRAGQHSSHDHSRHIHLKYAKGEQLCAKQVEPLRQQSSLWSTRNNTTCFLHT